MSNKAKLAILALLILVVAVFLWNRQQKEKQKSVAVPAKTADNSTGNATSGDQSAADQAAADFNAQCENGEWLKIADVQGDTVTLNGKLRKVYPEDDLPQDIKNFQYYVESQDKTALSGSDLSKLDNFEDRDVEVQGVKSSDGKSVAVSQVKCSGVETDKNVLDTRTKLMNWLAENINSVVPTKAPYQKWTVDTVEFVDEKNVYIEYYDIAEDGDNFNGNDTSRKVLLQVSAKSDGSYETNVLAYWEMGTDDYALKTGTDKFANVSDTFMYQYDSEQKSWTRI